MKRKFGPDQGHSAVRWLAEQMADQNPRGYEISCEPVAEPHTLKQQGQYWAALHEFGDWLGYSRSEAEKFIHEECLEQAFGRRAVKDLRGNDVWIPNQRSHNAKKADYGLLIDTLIRLAAENNYVIETAA